MADPMNVTGKPVTSVKDLYVNWKQMTAKEVIKKEKEGQTAPTEIIKWAEEMAKMANAPDNITYEAVNGVTDIDEIMKMIEEDNLEGDTAKPNLTAAQAERQSMQDSGVSLLEQGKNFTQKSKEEGLSSFHMMMSSSSQINTAEGLAESSEAQAKITEMITKNTKKEYDDLMKKAEDKNGQGITIEEQARLTQLGEKLQKIGNDSQNSLYGNINQVNGIASTLKGFEQIPAGAKDYGVETISVGTELINSKKGKTEGSEAANAAQGTENAQSEDINTRTANAVDEAQDALKDTTFFNLFSRKFRTGLQAIKQGASTISIANKSEEVLGNNQNKAQESKSTIQDSQQRVQDATDVEAKSPETGVKTENPNEDKTKTENQENDKQGTGKDQNADDKITTDPNEIIKRKQKKGIV